MLIHGNQIQTLNLQNSYDTKLNNATYDALKAFQLNTINSDTSDLSNSKLRDIEASVNTFFNSIASNFNMVGYNKDILTDYVPALVYTMYDGYYIYSPYNNTLDNTNANQVIVDDTGKIETKSDAEILNKNNENATYKQGERLSGLKPYIYYSCRYQKGNDDFVITYSLDNYITIQGNITQNGKLGWVYDAGYLIEPTHITGSGQNISYREIPIQQNQLLKEKMNATDPNQYEYIKLNGVKYYIREDGTCFSVLNGETYEQGKFEQNATPGIAYYTEAKEFTNRVLNQYGLSDLQSSHAVDEQGNPITLISGNYKIFESDKMKSLEDPDSNFNQQRLEVIRHSIEKNLAIAIANYNNYSGVTANFQMPKLKEDEWDKIINNVSIISFLQGLSIGGKMYNGYSIITNNKNQEVVTEDSIYIITNDNRYHRANDNDLKKNQAIQEGVSNIDFERKSVITLENGIERIKYFYPKTAIGCYDSIVTQTNVTATNNYYRYMAEIGKDNQMLASQYFTALGRERYGMYKTYNNPQVLKTRFGITV